MEETPIPIPAVLPEPPEPIAAAASTAEQDISIIDLLGAPTERKAESWEAPPEIDENLPGFDPPPPLERDAPPDPAAPSPSPGTKKDVPQELVSEGAHLMAPAVVEIIDAVIPPVINIYAKGDDPTLFCADAKAKGKMSEALADLLGSKNVQLSPGWIFALTVVAAYAPAGVQAYEMRKLQT